MSPKLSGIPSSCSSLVSLAVARQIPANCVDNLGPAVLGRGLVGGKPYVGTATGFGFGAESGVVEGEGAVRAGPAKWFMISALSYKRWRGVGPEAVEGVWCLGVQK